MTEENEAIMELEWARTRLLETAHMDSNRNNAFNCATKALEEVQRYREIGTVEELKTMKEHGGFTGIELAEISAALCSLREYRAIGTVETCKNAVEICKAMIERGIEPENVEAYIAFEDQCVQIGITIKGLLEAAEKQKPKSPNYEERKYIDSQLAYYTWICPCCGKRYKVDYDNYDYCPNCGQHIDRNVEVDDKTCKTIEKKILPEYYNAVISGNKTFELRKDEDNIQAGDFIVLKEWDGKRYTGRQTLRRAKYVLRDVPEYGLCPGYCIIGW